MTGKLLKFNKILLELIKITGITSNSELIEFTGILGLFGVPGPNKNS